MEFYTEEQVSRMLVSAIDRTAILMLGDESLPSEEALDNIIHVAKVHPSTFEVQKQIEAVRGLIASNLYLQNLHEQGRIKTDSSLDSNGIMEELNNQVLALRTLTETLKPYLGDDKLEA